MPPRLPDDGLQAADMTDRAIVGVAISGWLGSAAVWVSTGNLLAMFICFAIPWLWEQT
jgi:hypothetical protein